MERVFAGLQWEILLMYLDDIVVHAKTVGEEVNRLEEVFRDSADALSRKPCKQCGREEERSGPQEEQKAEETSDTSSEEEERSELPEELTVKKIIRGEEERVARTLTLNPKWTLQEMRDGQMADPSTTLIMQAVETGERPTWEAISAEQAAVKTYWAQWQQIKVRSCVLSRRWESVDGKLGRWQIVLPTSFRDDVLKELHDSNTARHQGVYKTLQKVGEPMDRIAMDVMGPLPRSKRGNAYVLVIGDPFTKWVEAYALSNQHTSTIARMVVEEFICRYGCPKELNSD
ncbi:uncharacterized protein LOC119733836 [Patiria miniata]|uniref:Integrase catalytic domain-containing protein n=1 Tax=Patiria miniata TaxID=46514 RepID=A0A914AHH5_PATMI|nr:uncharacterized protein LOC119733836 [Patiria miniata]